ncbi:MAG: hypothetical protein ABIS50_04195 [Luteolibacter sp.]|uniref:hypothetical protein n=1 Tax=Luteolibacter sp. TaxID=1962973 RepID=UPI003264BD2F
MAEVIQFNCPACGTTLRLPLAMAAQQGPCPSCQREIVAPDPYRGIGGYEVPPPVLSIEPEPYRPFAETPPLVPKKAEVIEKTPEPEPVEIVPEPPAEIQPPEVVATPPLPVAQASVGKQPQRAILVLSCLWAGTVGLAMGIAFGVRSPQLFTATPGATQPLIVVPKVTKPAVVVPPPVAGPAPAPVVEKPVVVAPKIDPVIPPAKVSAAAEAALQAFLGAPDWAARSAYVLYPDRVRAAMEAYSHEVRDGPTAFKSISVKQSQVDETSGNTLFIFIVATEQFPTGIPVAVKETGGGWLVDWLAFVEFRDSLFQKFLDGPAGKAGFFHLVVTVPPPSPTEMENEHFSNYLLQSPLAEKSRLAYVKKDSDAAATLEAQTASGRTYAPVLEVEKRTTPDKQDYFEILSVKADDWFPREN